MQFRFLSVPLAALTIALPFTAAQDLSALPSCAQGPAVSSIASTSCQLTDFACVCRDQAFIAALTPQIQKACSPADFQKVIAFTQSLCSGVGVTLSVPATATASAGTSSGSVLSSASVSTTGSSMSGTMMSATTTASMTGAAPAATTSSGAVGRAVAVAEGVVLAMGLGAWVVL